MRPPKVTVWADKRRFSRSLYHTAAPPFPLVMNGAGKMLTGYLLGNLSLKRTQNAKPKTIKRYPCWLEMYPESTYHIFKPLKAWNMVWSILVCVFVVDGADFLCHHQSILCARGDNFSAPLPLLPLLCTVWLFAFGESKVILLQRAAVSW